MAKLSRLGVSSAAGLLACLPAFLAVPAPPGWAPTSPPWINELHYENAGADTGEFVEIAGPAGTNLAGWKLIGYDAKKAKSYGFISLSGTIPDQQAQMGTLAFSFLFLQDGSPDGLALVDAGGALVEFISYEGAFTPTNGPAKGKPSVDIGVAEASGTPIGYSLQRAGSGKLASDFAWQPAGPQTRGGPNTGQIFIAPDTTPPAPPTGLTATGGDGSVDLDWNDGTEPDLAGYRVRRATTSGGPYTPLNGPLVAASAYADPAVTNGTTYFYVVAAVDDAGNESGSAGEVAATPQAVVLGSAFYVDPDGDDSNSGASTAQPWKTVGHAVGQLGPGDTLYLRAGTYRETGIAIGVSGTPTAPITIRNYPGEQPVVDGAFPEFIAPGNQAWELVDAGRQIYRSVGTYPGADYVFGYYGPGDGSWRLVPYEDYGPFSTDTEDYADKSPYYYIGPGVYWDSGDGRIYYRSQRSKYQVADGYEVPANADPRQTALFIFAEHEGIEIEGTAGHLVFEGLDVRHHGNAMHLRSGSHHITVRDCDLLGGRYHTLVRGGAHDLTFDDITIWDRIPPWIAWTDVKLPSIGRPGHQFQGSAIQLEDAVDRVEIMNGAFTGLFDGIGATDTPTNLHVHHNLFDVRDDVLQLGSAGWNVEFDHNVVLRAHSAGPSWNGSGSAPAAMVGTTYIHHNLLDSSQLLRFGRSDPQGLMDSKYQGPEGDGFAAGRTFNSHSKSDITGPTPWKIYHNTAIINDDVGNSGAGQAYDLTPFDPARPHEVYNNIFLQVGDEWVLRNARVADGSQVFDGNLYWAPNRSAGTDLLEDLKQGGNVKDFASLAGFLGSTHWSATQSYYAPGWEHSGIEADPQLDDQFRPLPGSPAASGAVDLSAKNWPGLAGETFRGAIAPAPIEP